MDSARLIEKLLAITKLKLRRISILYRFELTQEQPWVLGVDECILVKRRTWHRGKHSMNIISLCMPDDHKLVARLEKQKTVLLSRLNPSPGKRGETFNANRSGIGSRTGNRPLDANQSAIFNATFSAKTKLGKTTNSSLLVLQKPNSQKRVLKQAHALFLGKTPCSGKFCTFDVVQFADFLPYNTHSRFLVPQDVIAAADKQEFSPLFNPTLLLQPKDAATHKKTKSEDTSVLWPAQESGSCVPVCLRCYFIYKNVALSLKRAKGICPIG